MDRKKIICIVGESGSGKSFIADYLGAKYGIFIIESRTTRQPRHEGEKGHTWITEQEFDTYKKEDMIAFTEFGGSRYCCLLEDVVDKMHSYVIDEKGLKYLKKHFSDTFNIFAVRVVANEEKRKRKTDKKRIARDKGKFTMPLDDFDFYIINEYDSIKTYKQADTIINQIKKL